MESKNRKRPSSEKGFALVTALMACGILFALALLILQLSTGDLRVSAQNVGDKKAALAAEAGVQKVLASSINPRDLPPATDVRVDADNDSGSVYSFTTPIPPNINTTGRPAYKPLPGYSIGGTRTYSEAQYETRITGRNTRYGTSVQVDLGIGYFTAGGTDYN